MYISFVVIIGVATLLVYLLQPSYWWLKVVYHRDTPVMLYFDENPLVIFLDNYSDGKHFSEQASRVRVAGFSVNSSKRWEPDSTYHSYRSTLQGLEVIFAGKTILFSRSRNEFFIDDKSYKINKNDNLFLRINKDSSISRVYELPETLNLLHSESFSSLHSTIGEP